MQWIFVSFFAVALALAPKADAAPLMSQKPFPSTTLVQDVKVICSEDGHCYRPPVRRPVARWVYGDGNFSGPYAGPGYYGSPRYRYVWWPFFW